ncbi:CCA tRNA nucleotidyltransferase [Paracoccus sp. (in: a-proteobacteria)]|uniref:CCA tRNA nucleotidyltransferase n=1 Tax=Paracoccus sp. TaxID=267 RepID=UPI0026DEA5F0|nr:CCA tRNA nucleotidyltransferase [Paracoccus sp. (in: a-proteobacteria)]MDO5648753.1 CCA tRNA nucleotidyltransferase [Paracoccus sp. (in: a-proteobacteria)]
MRMPPAIWADPGLNRVLDALERGGRAWLVGGAVRNSLMGQPIDDIDIATDIPPDQVMTLAAQADLRTVPTGLDHGTITIISNGQGYEVTTLRRDVETDGRRAVVAFTDDLAQDAARRDFTMNALYAGRDGRVIDLVGGLPDLAARRLRFVGDPAQRIAEDYLRILRFFRLYARYGQLAEPGAVAACGTLRDGLHQIARERIGAEVKKLLAAPAPGASVALMADTGVLDVVLPGADADALQALLRAEDAPGDWPRRLAALSDNADALRLSRAELRGQTARVQAVAADWSLDRAGYELGADAGADVALIRASRGAALPADWRDRLARAATARLPLRAADLDLTGPAVGRALRAAEAAWIDSGFTLSRTELITAAGAGT